MGSAAQHWPTAAASRGGTRNQAVNREEGIHAGAGGVKGLNEDEWETANIK